MSQNRNRWLDIAKGIAIILMVAGHTPVTIQNWRIDYHVSFPYLRAKLKT